MDNSKRKAASYSLSVVLGPSSRSSVHSCWAHNGVTADKITQNGIETRKRSNGRSSRTLISEDLDTALSAEDVTAAGVTLANPGRTAAQIDGVYKAKQGRRRDRLLRTGRAEGASVAT